MLKRLLSSIRVSECSLQIIEAPNFLVNPSIREAVFTASDTKTLPLSVYPMWNREKRRKYYKEEFANAKKRNEAMSVQQDDETTKRRLV